MLQQSAILLPDIGEALAAKAKPLRRFPETGITPEIKLVMTNEKSVAYTLDAQGFSIEEVGAGWRRVQWQPFIAALESGQPIEAPEQNGQHCWIAIRKNADLANIAPTVKRPAVE